MTWDSSLKLKYKKDFAFTLYFAIHHAFDLSGLIGKMYLHHSELPVERQYYLQGFPLYFGPRLLSNFLPVFSGVPLHPHSFHRLLGPQENSPWLGASSCHHTLMLTSLHCSWESPWKERNVSHLSTFSCYLSCPLHIVLFQTVLALIASQVPEHIGLVSTHSHRLNVSAFQNIPFYFWDPERWSIWLFQCERLKPTLNAPWYLSVLQIG